MKKGEIMTIKLRDICKTLEDIAPLNLAAEWDNVGLLIGSEDSNSKISRMLLCIDLTEEVLTEAIRCKAQMVIAYHPLIFKPISRITSNTVPVVLAAARRGIAVYSPHTALDAADGGTNDVLADILDLRDRKPLEDIFASQQCKIVVFLPTDDVSPVTNAAFDAGAGIIGGYNECAFLGKGIGQFCGGADTKPTVGVPNENTAVEEVRLEMVAPRDKLPTIAAAIRNAHSYEEPAIDIYPLIATQTTTGQGRVGKLPRPVTTATLIAKIRKALKVDKVLVTGDPKSKTKVQIAAVTAGSCGSMWKSAAAAGATFYLTGEMRHHDALAASAAGLTCVCVGHSNSERIALKQLATRIKSAHPQLETILSKTDRDPFKIV